MSLTGNVNVDSPPVLNSLYWACGFGHWFKLSESPKHDALPSKSVQEISTVETTSSLNSIISKYQDPVEKITFSFLLIKCFLGCFFFFLLNVSVIKDGNDWVDGKGKCQLDCFLDSPYKKLFCCKYHFRNKGKKALFFFSFFFFSVPLDGSFHLYS